MGQPNSKTARAKVNLCLHITGKRPDGYHLLDSLVVFPNIGDVLTVVASDKLSLKIDGAFAEGLSATDNLVLDAARAFGPNRGAAITLTKNLPLNSGIGGGSADAAATLHLLTQHWQIPLPGDDKILALGADVPVCMSEHAQRMRGIGDVLNPLPKLPSFAILLVNSGESVATKQIFATLEYVRNSAVGNVPKPVNFEQFCIFLKAQRNDMQAAAIRLVPEINTVINALSNDSACRLARMSGSGGTCFGLFETLQNAQNAALRIKNDHPEWWVKAAIV